MRPDHSSTPNETLPPTSTSTAHAQHSARAAGGVASHAAAAATASSSSRGMGGSGRVHGGGGGGERGAGTAARPMKAVDVPELVLKLCKNILKKERDEDLLRDWHHALRIFNARIAERAEGDEHNMGQKIQRCLVQNQRVEDAASFARLHRRLQGQSNVRRHGAVINFLWSISDYNPTGHKVPVLFPPSSSIHLPSPFSSSTPTCSILKAGSRPYAGPWGDGPTPQLHHSGGPTPSSGISSIHPSTLGWSGQSSRHGVSSLPSAQPHPSQTTKSASHQTTSTSLRTTGVSLSGRSGPVPFLTETALVREVIYSLQGIDGSFLKLDRASDSWIVDDEPAVGKINKSKKLYMLRFAELGWMHNKIRQFVEGKGSERAYGLVGQSYLAALNQELTEFYRLVGVLESKLHQDEEAISRDEQSPEALTLRRLQVWLAEPMDRLKFVASMVDACKGLKGGALASSVAAHMQTGDPYLRVIVENILCWVALPIHAQLMAWIFDGELDDTFHEFFVASDPQVKPDRLWHDKYTLRRAMIPAFLSYEQANKILLSGKSINFLRQLCQDQAITDGAISGAIPGCPPRPAIAADINGIPGKSAAMQPVKCMFEEDILGQFQKLIDSSYTSTNKYLLEVLHQRYQFMDHLMGIRRYLLLGQGDFIRHLMDLLAEDLEKRADLLYMHNLTGTLETAIRATNAQYDNPEILKRLDARLLQVSTGDAGWDVFCLDYKVDSPISTVFTKESLVTYLRVFNFLWRVKRMEYILSNIWINQMADSRTLLRSKGPVLSETSYIIHLCQVITTEMVHFIGQLQYYITFEVLECSWDALLKKVKDAGDMDHLIAAHEEFLETIIKRSLLDDKSANILAQLRLLLDQIIKFQNIQNDMFAKALEEQERRVRLEGKKNTRFKDDQWGGGEEEEYTEVARRQNFSKNMVSPFKSKLMIVYQTYQDMMNKFLLMLNSHSDDNLKFLSFRLDFNEFYKSKEPKIRTSLCFRQSVSSPTNTAAPASAAAHLRHPNHPTPQPQQTPAAHHASMDKINVGQTEKRHRGLSSL